MTGLKNGNIIGEETKNKYECRGKRKILYDLEQSQG